MADAMLDEFAAQLMIEVRDRSIQSCDSLAVGQVGGSLGARWRELAAGGAREALSELIPDIVDQVLFYLLDAIDNNRLPLAWRSADSSYTPLVELGHREMAGLVMMGKGGWVDRYSRQRYYDPFGL